MTTEYASFRKTACPDMCCKVFFLWENQILCILTDDASEESSLTFSLMPVALRSVRAADTQISHKSSLGKINLLKICT